MKIIALYWYIYIYKYLYIMSNSNYSFSQVHEMTTSTYIYIYTFFFLTIIEHRQTDLAVFEMNERYDSLGNNNLSVQNLTTSEHSSDAEDRNEGFRHFDTFSSLRCHCHRRCLPPLKITSRPLNRAGECRQFYCI